MIEQEQTFPLREANRESGLDFHLCTWFRYAGRGLRGERLDTLKKGGSTQTSREAIRRFFAALTERRYQVKRSGNLDADRQARVIRELEGRFKL